MDLKGKRILFFSAKAFGIPENIVDALKTFGAKVDYYDERPANSFIVKALIRINRNLIGAYINKYHFKIIENTKHFKYDYIILIKGESFSEHNLQKLLSYHPDAISIVYHWDSIANNHNAISLLNNFDKAFSFDRHDCEKIGINFLPLFYYNEYRDIAEYTEKVDYDLLFVGTTHSDRYRFIKSIASQIKALGGKCFTYFFFQGKIMYYKYRLYNYSEMKNAHISDFHFKPIDKQQLLELYKKSRIIVDIQHPKQSGLTLRTMEALGAKKKLITTNGDVKFYDFYHPDNILIVDRQNPVIDKAFLDAVYKDIPKDIYEKYSINTWLENLLSL